jgi:hypothetical protein
MKGKTLNAKRKYAATLLLKYAWRKDTAWKDVRENFNASFFYAN